MEAIGYLIGGVGLFFVGLHLLSSGLRQITGRRFRLRFAKWLGTSVKAGVVGFAAGFLSQSMSALSFIVGSLVGAGIIPARRGMLIIFWANAGIGIMILLAVLDIKILVLFLMGLAGVSFAFKRPKHMEKMAQALFGAALLFYGLIMLRTGAEPLAAMPWFGDVLIRGQSSYLLSFLAGALLTALCQSSTAVSILAIALTQVGLFSMEQTMMIIYGTNVGSSAISWLLSTTIRGTAKQLIMSQVFFNFAAALVFVPLFYLEVLAGVPLVQALVQSLQLPMEQQAALVYLLFNWGGALALSLLLTPFYNSIVRGWPATAEEKWSKTAFLCDDIADAPELALPLLGREQARLVCMMVRYSEVLQGQIKDDRGKVVEALHSSFQTVSREIDSQAAEVIKHPLSRDGLELLMTIQNKQKQMSALDDLLHQFTVACRDLSRPLRETFDRTFLQGLDFLLQTACEAELSADVSDPEHLVHLTQDKGEVFQAIRKSYLHSESSMRLDDRNAFLDLTSLFERIVWTLGRIAKLQHTQKLLEQSNDAGLNQ